MNIIAAGTGEIILGIIAFFISLAMIFIVLIQKEKGGGLSGAFGGSGSISTFGVKTSHVVEKATWFLFILFVTCTFVMAAVSAKTNTDNKAAQTEEDKAKKEETTENKAEEGSGKKAEIPANQNDTNKKEQAPEKAETPKEDNSKK